MNEELESLMDNTPSWLFRSGISMIGVSIIFFVFLSAFIKYPDLTISRGIMTSETPPIDHKSNTTGIIDSLYVNQNAKVKAGDRLLLIKNTCDPQDIATIKDFISKYEGVKNIRDLPQLYFPSNLHLGELQNDYVNFEMSFMEFIEKLNDPFFDQKIEVINEEISNVERLNHVLEKQTTLFKKELSLVENDHSRSQTLKSTNVISDLEMEKADRELITIQKQIIALESNSIENKIRKEILKLEINKLQSEKADFQNRNIVKLKGLLSSLNQSIKNWEEKYIVTAKISGRILYPSNITKKIKINENDIVASILPKNSISNHYVRAIASDKGIGKIKTNAKVILKVDGYPYKEYGVIISKITSISPIPKEDRNGNLFYDLTILLPNKISTNYNIEIPFRPNTGITAEILNEENSILERIFQQFLNLIKKR